MALTTNPPSKQIVVWAYYMDDDGFETEESCTINIEAIADCENGYPYTWIRLKNGKCIFTDESKQSILGRINALKQ